MNPAHISILFCKTTLNPFLYSPCIDIYILFLKFPLKVFSIYLYLIRQGVKIQFQLFYFINWVYFLLFLSLYTRNIFLKFLVLSFYQRVVQYKKLTPDIFVLIKTKRRRHLHTHTDYVRQTRTVRQMTPFLWNLCTVPENSEFAIWKLRLEPLFLKPDFNTKPLTQLWPQLVSLDWQLQDLRFDLGS